MSESEHMQVDIQVTDSILELKTIVRFFPPNHRILNQISLIIHSGETVRILGKSGSGKTVLTEILTGQVMPDHGDVFFEGDSFRMMSNRERQAIRCRYFAVLGREAGFLRQLTMRDNVALPLILMGEKRKIAHRKAEEAMAMFGMEQAVIRHPEKLTPGEMARCQLARASLNSPKILVADSFAVGMTHKEEKEIWDMLKHLQEKNGSVLIHLADEPGGTGDVDRILRLTEGQLLEEERKC